MDSRRQVKDLLKREKLTEAQRQQLNIRQLGRRRGGGPRDLRGLQMIVMDTYILHEVLV